MNDTTTDETTPLAGAAVLAERLGGPDWQERAACRDLTPVAFYSDELDDVTAAKRLCLTCPVRRACLDAAVANREPAGVWGGHLFVDGRIVLQKRRRGRPPRQARPEDTFPQVDLPEDYRWLVARRGSEPVRT